MNSTQLYHCLLLLKQREEQYTAAYHHLQNAIHASVDNVIEDDTGHYVLEDIVLGQSSNVLFESQHDAVDWINDNCQLVYAKLKKDGTPGKRKKVVELSSVFAIDYDPDGEQ